jgi:hypothetical protein
MLAHTLLGCTVALQLFGVVDVISAHRVAPPDDAERPERYNVQLHDGSAQARLQVAEEQREWQTNWAVEVHGMKKPRKLHGRFLHITDLHPDPFFETGASVSSHCHRKKPKHEEERAGYYGVPFRFVAFFVPHRLQASSKTLI